MELQERVMEPLVGPFHNRRVACGRLRRAGGVIDSPGEMIVAERPPAPRLGNRPRVLQGALLLLLIAAGVGAIIALGGGTLRYPDEREYLTMARHLVDEGVMSGSGSAPTAYRPPGYVWFLAALLNLSSSVVSLKLANLAALAVSCWIMGRFLASEGFVFGPPAVPALVIGYPVLLYTAGTLYPQTLGGCLLVAVFALLHGCRPTAAIIASAGALWGLLILTIPTFLLMTPVALLSIWSRRHGAHVVRTGALFLLVATAFVGSWTYRNYRVLHAFVPVSTNGGENLLLGNSPEARADSGVMAGTAGAVSPDRMSGLTEVQRDEVFRAAAVDWIRAHPGAALRLYAQKFVYFFSVRNRLWVKAEASIWRDLIMGITYAFLVLLVAVRLVLEPARLARWEAHALIWYVGFAAVSALFFVRIRFRLPVDLLLILMAAAQLSRSVDRRIGQGRQAAA